MYTSSSLCCYHTFQLTAEYNFTPSTVEYLMHFSNTYNFYLMSLTSTSLRFVPKGLAVYNEIPRRSLNKFAQFPQSNRNHLFHRLFPEFPAIHFAFRFLSPYCSKLGTLKMNCFILNPHEPPCIHHRITSAITSHIRLYSSSTDGLHNPLTLSNPMSSLLSFQPGSGRGCGVTHCGGDTLEATQLWSETQWRRHTVA
jgi:hypothetical protein